jgi:hypothetical protein
MSPTKLILLGLAAAAAAAAGGCGTGKETVKPDDMSAAQHREEAARETLAARQTGDREQIAELRARSREEAIYAPRSAR